MLDVGFGAGEALIELARDRPDECVIGVEVHTTGLAAVLEAGLPNVRVVDGDVLDFLPRLAPASLDEIRIWFPDPWPKQRQRHRRLIRPDVVARLVALPARWRTPAPGHRLGGLLVADATRVRAPRLAAWSIVRRGGRSPATNHAAWPPGGRPST